MSPRRYASPKREAAAARTRQRLVRAAVKLLQSRTGLRALSLESVARAAGVSRLTVYNQFGSRRGLLEAVFDDRASRGGLFRLPQAMANPDPHTGLAHLIEIFCGFWEFNRRTISAVLSAAGSDALLRDRIRSRSERRREALSVLVGRLVPLSEVRPEAAADLVDVLFALTTFQMFAELARRGRDAAAVCRLIQGLAEDAVQGAG